MMTLEELIEKASRLTDAEKEALRVAFKGEAESDRQAAWEAAIWAAWAMGDDTWDEARFAVWGREDAVWAAVSAFVVRNRISEEHFNTLYGPWASVMER